MKIRSIAVKELMKFDAPVQIVGIDDRLNIISGPNEMGKSTILSALRAAFFSRYSSVAKDIKKLQNSQNLGTPVVKVEFEVNSDRYQIRKQFVKKRLAELRFPDGRIFRGDAAEDELQRLIGFGDSDGGGGQSADMWNLFWVEQGKSFTPISVSDKARSSLHAALESEVGTVLGGRRGRELPKIFSDQRNRYVTATGRERGDFKKLGEKVDVIREAVTSLEMRRETLSNSLDRLEQCQKGLKRLEDEGIDQQILQELEDLRSKEEEILKLDLTIKAVKSNLDRITGEISALDKEVRTRRELEEEVKQANRSQSNTSEYLESCKEKKSAIQTKRDEHLFEVNRLNSQIADAEKNVRKAEEVLDLAKELSELTNLKSRIRQTQELIRESRELSAEAKIILVTDDKIDQIQNAKSKLDVTKATIKASATRISFELKSGGANGITVDGNSIDSETYEFETISQIGIDIPERGLISVTPAVQDESQLLENERAAVAEYEEALRSANAKSFEEAKNLGSKRKMLLQNSVEKDREVRNCLPEIDQFGNIEAVQEFVELQHNILNESVKSLNLSEPPQVSTAQVKLDNMKSIPERLRPELERHQHELDQIESRLTDAKVELARIQEKHDNSEERLNKLKIRLTILNQSKSMADLKEEKRQLTTERNQLSRELDILEKNFSGSSIDMIRARIGRLEEQLSNRESSRWQLREEISRLIGHIESFEGAGIDEEIEQKYRELHAAQSEYRRIEQEVAILDLLIKTLNNAEMEAKEKFLSPIVTRIKPYLDRLFPDAELVMDEDLEIVEIKRKFDESFGNLSMGTQEQIAVLVRLTFATMLAEQGRPATVILDDALVFSDEERMKTMFDILFDASRTVQIIVLTCRKSLFEGLGGNILSVECPADI